MSTNKITAPPRPNGDLAATNEKHRVVRERHFTAAQFHSVLQLIHDERITGTLMLDLQQGGVRNIRLQEEQSIRIDDPAAK